jgi:hypothetical protein
MLPILRGQIADVGPMRNGRCRPQQQRALTPWPADGKELFYLEASPNFGRTRLIAVPIGTGPNPVGAPKSLFEFKTLLYATTSNAFGYVASADGQRFLVDRCSPGVQPSLDVIFDRAFMEK